MSLDAQLEKLKKKSLERVKGNYSVHEKQQKQKFKASEIFALN